jgi:hypothetical protein
MAEQLRLRQRQFGTAAVHEMVLGMLGQYENAGVPDYVLGRKLDVPPSLIAVWRAEEERENIDQLTISPRTWLAREFASIKQRERQARQKLNDPKLGVKAWSAAQTVLSQCARQRLVLLERAGIPLELPPSAAEIPIDERRLHHLLSLKASLAEIMVAAGVDPHTKLEDAADAFRDALDNMSA